MYLWGRETVPMRSEGSGIKAVTGSALEVLAGSDFLTRFQLGPRARGVGAPTTWRFETTAGPWTRLAPKGET